MSRFTAIVLSSGCQVVTTPPNDTALVTAASGPDLTASDSMSDVLSWRLLGTGEVGNHDSVLFGDEDCADFRAVLLSDQDALDGWDAELGDVDLTSVDWSSEVAVGATTVCRNMGRTITMLEPEDIGEGTLRVRYQVDTAEELYSLESVLWHAGAVEAADWQTVRWVVVEASD